MTTNNGNGAIYDADRASCMAAFDQLPRSVREALAGSDHNWSARQVYRCLRGKGKDKKQARDAGIHSAADMVAFIAKQDAAKHARDAGVGLIWQ